MSTQYRRFINQENFTRNQRFIIFVCCFGRETWNANSWCKYADRNQPRLSRKWQREGKGRRNQGRWFEFSLHASGSFRCNRPVFRATRAVAFSFDDIHATCDSRHVHTCISLFLKSINPDGGYLPSVVRLLRVPFLTSSNGTIVLCFERYSCPSLREKKWSRVEKWTR